MSLSEVKKVMGVRYNGVVIPLNDLPPNLQEKIATGNGEIVPDIGYDGLSKVIVDVPIPDGYIQPSGELEITANGAYDVTEKASVAVNVASGEDLNDVLTEQEALIAELKDTLRGKASGGAQYEIWTITYTDGTVEEKEVALL